MSHTKKAVRVAMGLLVSMLLVLAIGASPASADSPTKILFLMDVSGSMNAKLPDGQTKLAAAKQAIKQVAGSLPAGTNVGLRVYGSKISQPKSVNPAACKDTDLVLPIGPLNQSKLNTAVDSFKAVGETPIAYSMTKAVGDLGKTGHRVLILVSDGEEDCVKNPCPTAKKLAGSGVNIQFNAVGFNVDDKARNELRCIANAGNGSYYDANESGSLTNSLQKITARALRPFKLSGTPVAGTPQPGTAPTLADGQYLDSFAASVSDRYYKINRQPGAAVAVSLANVNAPPSGSGSQVSFYLTLRTSDGTTCDSQYVGSTSYQSADVATDVVGAPGPGASASGPCATDPLELEVQPEETLASQPFKVELVVSSTPPVTNLAQLPPPAGKPGTAKPVAAGKDKHVIGGTSFVEAAPIGPGTYTDSIAAGETLFYKVPLTWGQAMRVTTDLPEPGTPWDPSSLDGFYPGVALFSPDRAVLSQQVEPVSGADGAKTTISAQTAPVRYRNRQSSAPSVSWADRDGDYYIAVSLGASDAEETGRLMQIRLRVTVGGNKTGVPVYDTSSTSTASASPSAGTSAQAGASADPSASAAPTAGQSSAGASPTVTAAPGQNAGQNGSGVGLGGVIGIVVLVVVIAGGGGLLLGRRFRRSNSR